jgi:hypothetical protein
LKKLNNKKKLNLTKKIAMMRKTAPSRWMNKFPIKKLLMRNSRTQKYKVTVRINQLKLVTTNLRKFLLNKMKIIIIQLKMGVRKNYPEVKTKKTDPIMKKT